MKIKNDLIQSENFEIEGQNPKKGKNFEICQNCKILKSK